MAFVADGLASWLVGQLADAGRRRLATWVLGSDQERELRRAGSAALLLAAGELRPEGGERAEELAMVLSQVFSAPVPDASVRAQATLLEAIQAGIVRQLSVLDDAGITGTGRSSAELLGLSAETLAEKLTGHLVREIVVRGSRGGPLEPLAAQLNHDAIHLQGRRLEGRVGRLAASTNEWITRLEGDNAGEPSVAKELPAEASDCTVVALDIVGYGTRSHPDQRQAQAAMDELLGQALTRAGIEPSDYERSDRGDGILVLLNTKIPHVKVLTNLIPSLAEALDHQNQVLRSRIRLRAVVDTAKIFRDAHGYVGKDLNTVFRLLDSAFLRDYLARTSADLVLLTSDRIHSEAIEQGYVGLHAGTFRHIYIADKGIRAPAWAYVPEPHQESLPQDPSELPAEIPYFSGRSGELDHLMGLLDQAHGGGPSTVVLQGLGGVGKTTLAITAAHRLASRFPDGQLFVNLHGTTAGHSPASPLDALSQLLRGLGDDLREIPPSVDEAAARFQSLLAGQRILLVLDNAASAAQVRPLIPDSPTCAALITSRRSLRNLESVAHLDLDILAPESAIRLFRGVVGDERVDSEPQAAEELAELCGYLPLALRIAGAHLAGHPKWPLSRLAESLADERARLSNLTANHFSVRSSLQISYQALKNSDNDRDRTAARLFRFTGLYAALDVEARTAAALLDTSPAEADAALKRLADINVLMEMPTAGRYRMHDLVRLLAREASAEDEEEPERNAALRRLIEYYLMTVQRASRLLHSDRREEGRGAFSTLVPPMSTRAEALAWFDAEQANLTGALEQAVAVNLSASVPNIADCMFVYYKARKHWAPAALVQELALTAARENSDRQAEAKILINLGEGCSGLDRLDDALMFLEQGIALCRDVGDHRGERLGLTALGRAYRQRGDLAASTTCLQQGLLVARAIGDRSGEGQVLADLGGICAAQGRFAEAAEHYQSAIIVARQAGDRGNLATSLMGLGDAARGSGQLRESIEFLKQSLAIYAEDGYGNDRAAVCASLASSYRIKGNYSKALEYYQQSLRIARNLGDEQGQVCALVGLGEIYTHTNEYKLAVGHLTRAVELAPDLTDPRTEADVYMSLAVAYRHLGDLEAALYCCQRGLHATQGIGDRQREAACLISLASMYHEFGRLDESISCYEYGLGVFRDLGDRSGEAAALERLAEVQRALGRFADAIACVDRSHVLRDLVRLQHDGIESPGEPVP